MKEQERLNSVMTGLSMRRSNMLKLNWTENGSGKTFIRVSGISVAILLTGPDRFAFSILNAVVKT